MKADPNLKSHKIQAMLVLLKDLEGLGPHHASLKSLEGRCDRIARELESHLGTIDKRTDPARYDKLHSILQAARSLKNKARSARRKADHPPSAPLLYSYGNLFGQLQELLAP